jgi:hypothetical protein
VNPTTVRLTTVRSGGRRFRSFGRLIPGAYPGSIEPLSVVSVVVAAHGVHIVPAAVRGPVAPHVVAAVVVMAVRFGSGRAESECGDGRQN